MTEYRKGSSGPLDARVLVVGEAYGAAEALTGAPFVGPAGKLLRETLNSVGIDSDQVYYTNITHTRPPSNELRTFFDSHGQPNQAIVEGLTALKQEIDLVNPSIIIPLGNYPFHFLTGRGRWSSDAGYTGIGDYRGFVVPGSGIAGGRRCLPTYHPAAALRQYSLKHIIRADLAKALRVSKGTGLQYSRRHHIIDPAGPDRDAWAAWLRSPEGTLSPAFISDGANSDRPAGEQVRLASDSFMSADIEYIGNKLLCVGFTRHSGVAIVYSTPSHAAIEFVRSILLCGIPLCFQNGMFDCSILEWFFAIPCIQYLKHDTMLMMHAAYIEMQKDLGFIGSLFTDAPPWFQHINKDFWNSVRDGSRSIMEVLPYNAWDVSVTHEAAVSLLGDELQDADIARTYSHEMSLIQPLWTCGKRGVRIDTEKLAELKKTLQFEADALNHGIAAMNLGIPVNVKSPPQVATFLYSRLAVPQVGPKTPGGRWKMDDATLAALSLRCRDENQRKGIRMVREARERLDLISKFCEIELDTDERMRCHYDPAKTTTGRLSSRKFFPTGRGTNLQNVPRDIRVRSVFIPDPGRVFGYADLKSAESFAVAHITGDIEMLRLHGPEYMSGAKDGHKFVASFLLGKPIELVTKDERYLGKRVRHAGNYGMSWNKLMMIVNADAQTTGVSIDAAQAKSLIGRYRQLHPFLVSWWSDIQAELWRSHTLYSLHRRKRVFYDRPDAILPEAIAYVPQSTIADTLNMGLLNVFASEELRDLGFELLLQVHDAIGFQCPEANMARALELLPALMDIPVPISRRGVPSYNINIPVEIQVGYNWGEFDPKKPDFNPNGLRSYDDFKRTRAAQDLHVLPSASSSARQLV